MKKQPVKRTKKAAQSAPEFRPYRVLFLIVVVSVTCLVLFAALGAGV